MKLRMFALFCSLLTPLMVFAAPTPMPGPTAPMVGPDFFQSLMWAFYFIIG
jgi:hypothetical protein